MAFGSLPPLWSLGHGTEEGRGFTINNAPTMQAIADKVSRLVIHQVHMGAQKQNFLLALFIESDFVRVQMQDGLRLWRAKFGADRDVYSAQEHPPARQGVALTHRLFQFALAYSGWRHVNVIDSG